MGILYVDLINYIHDLFVMKLFTNIVELNNNIIIFDIDMFSILRLSYKYFNSQDESLATLVVKVSAIAWSLQPHM